MPNPTTQSSQSFDWKLHTQTNPNPEIQNNGERKASFQVETPQITLPKGGGALKSIDEKFSVNAVNGSAAFSIPLPITPGRNGFSPALTLNYNSGVGNSPFGLGWNVDFPAIQRKTDKQLPRYLDGEEEDVFMFSGVEDLVPSLDKDTNWTPLEKVVGNYKIRQYLPRIEGSFSRIERITPIGKTSFYWKVTTKDNTVIFFGRSQSHCIADPADSSKIFKWLPEFSFDDKGNVIVYAFKKEDGKIGLVGLHDKNRFDNKTDDPLFTQLYLKRIRYGNHMPFYPRYITAPANIDEIYNTQIPQNQDYFYELVFDYGEHEANLITETTLTGQAAFWKVRTDAFSDHRPGFEMRTYRLCERVLMFHHFEELLAEYGAHTCLVKSLDLAYQRKSSLSDQPLEVTYLNSITQTGYLRNKVTGQYTVKSLPAMEFTYNELKWNTEIKTITPENIINAPTGLSGNYQWVDLYNEGICGILTEQADAWYYKSNLGNGEFSIANIVSPKPSFSGIPNGTLQLQDIEANGKRHAVITTQETKGYFELSDDNEWQPFCAFEQMPAQDFRDPNAKFIDLNGDGMPDLVVSEENAFIWYPAIGLKGYDAAEFTAKPFDEEQGPSIVFADSTQSIFLADMSGDGLTDIVRIRNKEICYWPNLGYGSFGAKVNMSHPPDFDYTDQFNPSYLHLADVSGTGATDILYLGENKCRAWLNLSGNSWSTPCEIDPFLPTEQPNQVAVIDLLGNGTSCIVWSSPLPSYSNTPMRYIDLMGGCKPHIIVKQVNNLGKETFLDYKSSSYFYLEDKKSGKPWVTKLPFPVQCLSKVEVVDTVTDLRFTKKYNYHHGYYDHHEREFRGFGMVEQVDTEEYEYLKNSKATNATDVHFHEFPVLTKTWFHTGAYLRNVKILNHFKDEYWYKNASLKQYLADAGIADPDKMEWQLPDAQLDGNLSTPELVEAHRACKGMMLRQETFALDGTSKAHIPYTVATHNCQVKMLQPKNENRHAVFLVQESEAITFSYERNIKDPRVSHTLNLEIDQFGNVLKSASVIYRRVGNAITETVNELDLSLRHHLGLFKEAQGKEHIVYTQSQVTIDAGEKNNGQELFYYRLPVPWLVKTFEAEGISKKHDLYVLPDFKDVVSGVNIDFLRYEEKFKQPHSKIQLRLLEQVQTLLLSYDLQNPLKAGTHGALGMSYESYQLAFTPELVNVLYNTDDSGNTINPLRVTNLELLAGKYCHMQPEEQNWWIRSGTIQYIDATAGENRDKSAQRFYLPVSFTDPFGSVTRVTYYKSYHLLIQQTQDALENTVSVEAFDFRTLSPRKVKDVNANFIEVAIDTLGLVVGTAIMGKGTQGDDLVDFIPDLSLQQIQNFFADPITNGRDLLQHATTRLIYDFSRIPCSVGTIVREEHHHMNPNPALQYSVEYAGGLGNVVMKKIQAEAGDAPHRDQHGKLVKKPNGELDLQPALHRWVGNGRTILNNKGKPVKQYEPYFSNSHLYEDEPELIESGVTPVLHYDAAGRLVKTIMPDDTYTKVEYDAWMQKTYDANDTTVLELDGIPLESKWYSDRINNLLDEEFIRLGKDPLKEKQAAKKAAIHANTPSIVHTDSLGRPFYTIAHNRFDDFAANSIKEEFYSTHTILDIEGNIRAVIDARGKSVMEYSYDMLGHQVYQKSMDAGERWLLNDSMGKPVFVWDSKQQRVETTYDALHRPVELTITRLSSASTTLFEKLAYVDMKGLSAAQLAAQQAKNLVGIAITHYDSAGIVRIVNRDFKGNILEGSRQLCLDYKTIPDWKTPESVPLETEVFISASEWDALNRPIKILTPHTPLIPASVITPRYNEANLLNEVSTKLRGSNEVSIFVKNIDYDAKGQRLAISYGNNTVTRYSYDLKTFRLLRLLTTRNRGADNLQDLNYTYDAVGNITFIKDDALQSIFFNNTRVDPDCEYVYDSIYRLIQAKGREHTANNTAPGAYDAQRTKLPHKGDGNQLQPYTQRYQYDAAGNMLLMHNLNSWSRKFTYSNTNNQLLTAPANHEIGTPFTYTYDKHGNMMAMPHLPVMDWNFKDQLQHVGITASNVNDMAVQAFYVYDASGERLRKVVEKNNVTEERIYLGGFEIFRKRRNGIMELERETLHVMDNTRRIALVDTKIKPNHEAEAPLIRYQYSNHLGSASLELDGSDNAQIISYEEYYPYGSTSYQGTDQTWEVPIKRYRYTGKERDEESGLEYHSARYYAPWLGRWINCDPAGLVDGVNLYCYVSGAPIQYIDPSGQKGLQRVENEDKSAEYYQDSENGIAIVRSKAGIEVWEEVDTNQYNSVVTLMQPEVYTHPTAKSVANDFKELTPDKFMAKHGVTFMQYNELQKVVPPIVFEPVPEDKTKYIDPQTGVVGTSGQLADANLAQGISNVNQGTGLGGAYSLAAVSLGADAKEAARMGNIGNGWAPIFSMAAAAPAVIGLKKTSSIQPETGAKSATFEASARDLKAPRGTETNPIPAEELVRFKVVTNGRKIEPTVERQIDALMKRQYGPDMTKGRRPGQYQIAHDPALPWILTPDGQPANVFGQLLELNRVGTGKIRSTAGSIRKQNLSLAPNQQTFVRPAR